MDHTACIVMTTASTEDEAESLASAIVEARLAACVQVQRVRSFYIWKDEPHHEPEWLLMIKTLPARYEAIEAFVRERHSYETPEVVQVPITGGSPDYLQWLAAGSRGGGAPAVPQE
ncbi:divalent-cation tolerance protein CutA [Variovorax sp. KK3]|uniref:divalent-cation tolerance protein CutA n=1 Tax=Variovorax sp. KK3 TaxID=1855728 RepID=UPI00097CACFB|nr:divalent-cation tolerance protein CutA [Variovorax sp. KK3]